MLAASHGMSELADNPALPEPAPPPWWFTPAVLALAAVALGYAIHVRDGEYWPSALGWLTVALALCVLGVARPRWRGPAWGNDTLLYLLVAAYAFQFFQLLRSPPGGWNEWSDDLRDKSANSLRLYYGGVLAAAVLTGLCLLDRPRLRRVCLPLLLVTHLMLGMWMVRSSPRPDIDVFYFQQEGARALLAGENPYGTRMPDIYAGTERAKDRDVYGEGLSQDGRLNFGFPYTPLSLLLAAAGYLAAGDHRYAQAVAMTLAGAFVAYGRPGTAAGAPARVSAAAGALLLFTPRAFFILGRGWTEPFVVLGLAATVFVACRFPCKAADGIGAEVRKPPGNLLILAAVLGLFLATKQYLIFVAPAVLLLVPSPFTWRKFLLLFGGGVLVAAAVTAPLALWDVGAFVHSTGTVQKVAPFRTDALSFLAWFHLKTGAEPGVTAAFVAMAAGAALALWRAPRSPAGFAAAVAMIYLPFIAFNKQAFANYYYFVIGALWCAVAAMPPPPESPKSPAAPVR